MKVAVRVELTEQELAQAVCAFIGAHRPDIAKMTVTSVCTTSMHPDCAVVVDGIMPATDLQRIDGDNEDHATTS